MRLSAVSLFCVLSYVAASSGSRFERSSEDGSISCISQVASENDASAIFARYVEARDMVKALCQYYRIVLVSIKEQTAVPQAVSEHLGRFLRSMQFTSNMSRIIWNLKNGLLEDSFKVFEDMCTEVCNVWKLLAELIVLVPEGSTVRQELESFKADLKAFVSFRFFGLKDSVFYKFPEIKENLDLLEEIVNTEPEDEVKLEEITISGEEEVESSQIVLEPVQRVIECTTTDALYSKIMGIPYKESLAELYAAMGSVYEGLEYLTQNGDERVLRLCESHRAIFFSMISSVFRNWENSIHRYIDSYHTRVENAMMDKTRREAHDSIFKLTADFASGLKLINDMDHLHQTLKLSFGRGFNDTQYGQYKELAKLFVEKFSAASKVLVKFCEREIPKIVYLENVDENLSTFVENMHRIIHHVVISGIRVGDEVENSTKILRALQLNDTRLVGESLLCAWTNPTDIDGIVIRHVSQLYQLLAKIKTEKSEIKSLYQEIRSQLEDKVRAGSSTIKANKILMEAITNVDESDFKEFYTTSFLVDLLEQAAEHNDSCFEHFEVRSKLIESIKSYVETQSLCFENLNGLLERASMPENEQVSEDEIDQFKVALMQNVRLFPMRDIPPKNDLEDDEDLALAIALSMQSSAQQTPIDNNEELPRENDAVGAANIDFDEEDEDEVLRRALELSLLNP